ncbi:hypothetical protein LINPERPRIM_LOCUS79, partial [Linum perenne]
LSLFSLIFQLLPLNFPLSPPFFFSSITHQIKNKNSLLTLSGRRRYISSAAASSRPRLRSFSAAAPRRRRSFSRRRPIEIVADPSRLEAVAPSLKQRGAIVGL